MNHFTRAALGIALALVPLTACLAQPARPLTEDESVRFGLERNARVQAARADAAEARAALQHTRASRLPTIQTQASYTRLSDNIPEVDFAFPGMDTTFTLLPVELSRYHSEISIEQPLFTGFRVTNRIRAAGHEAEAVLLRARQEEADVAFQIRQAYWQLHRASAVRDAMDAALAQVDEHLRDVQNRYETGAALAGDVLTARTRRSEVLLERLNAEAAVRTARLELNRLAGLPLDAQTEVDGGTEPLDSAALPDTLSVHAIAGHPQIAALGEQLRALNAMEDATRGTWLPEVAAVGRYVYARPNPHFFLEQDQFRGTWEAGLSMRWSLFDGGRRIAETRQARERMRAAEARLDDALRTIAVVATRRQFDAEHAEEAVAVAAQGVSDAEESHRVTRQLFQEGAALSTQVLDAEQAVRSAQTRLATARAERAIARAALLNAMGRVW
jgi:outer membrane protein